jgi:hypothetical protein
MIPKAGPSIENQYRSYVETTYYPVPKDQQEKIIDSLLSLLELAGERRQPLRDILEQACRTMFRLFGFREISIGLKSREDFLYRYEVLFGYRRDVIDNMRKMKYTFEDMVSQEKFPHIKMGKLSELNPVEGLPEWERGLFSRPSQLEVKREIQTEFLEGDYIDVWIHGNNGDLVGWIELSNPLDGKLPERATVRWIELIASILGHIISEKWMEEEASRK